MIIYLYLFSLKCLVTTLSSVRYYSSHLVSDEDILRLYLQKIRRICHENDRKLMIFHFKSDSVKFILNKQKGRK